ncbi:MAG: putative sugar dehydratase/epimerase YfnG [Nitrospirales bacterium]|nr:MAG: putative sugar dehydratase/epimerase YfnG [Nitrospirales bacterium]
MSMTWSENRVLVTGATGIVGSWLVKSLLEQGAFVATLIRDWNPQSELIRSGDVQRTTVVSGELENYQALERAISENEIDTVFHLAAQPLVGIALRSPLPTFEANIRGSYHVLEACRIHKNLVKRIVVASSDKAYGDVEVLPYTEDMPPLGRFPYDVSKSCTDLLARSYSQTYDLPVTIARCGNIFGGGDLNWSRIVPGTIRSFLKQESPVIRSDGKFTRDYIFVLDVVQAYLLLASHAREEGVRGEAFNFSGEQPWTVLDVVSEIQMLMECHQFTPIVLNQANAEIRDQYLDSGKAKRRLKWAPLYSLGKGLVETITWYKKFLEPKSTKKC